VGVAGGTAGRILEQALVGHSHLVVSSGPYRRLKSLHC
jgi:hypothetical protein